MIKNNVLTYSEAMDCDADQLYQIYYAMTLYDNELSEEIEIEKAKERKRREVRGIYG